MNEWEELTSYKEIPKIDDCFGRNEQGDAELFASLVDKLYIYDSAGQWYKFVSPYWEAIQPEDLYHEIGNRVAQMYVDRSVELFAIGDQSSTARAKDFFSRAASLRTKKRAAAVISWAESPLRLAENWDKTPMILACENGVIDLVTGKLREARPTDYIRAHAITQWYDIDHGAPLWERTVSQIFGDDTEMVQFFQRLMGYALSGLSNERVLPILFGTGANGKTTLKEAITATLGSDYFQETSAQSLMESKHDDGRGPSPLIVALQGKRYLWASESKEGQRLDMGFVKALTGGDTMSGRGMYAKKIVSFRPTHTPFLITNPLPHISADDQAAWDRILPIEFGQRFTDNPKPGEYKKIAGLKERLSMETPGILAWLVRGCMEWQRVGINPPQKVLDRLGEYRNDEDDFGIFCAECLGDDNQAAKLSASAAFVAYADWAVKYRMPTMSRTAFGRRMGKRYRKEKTSTGIIYLGVRLI